MKPILTGYQPLDKADDTQPPKGASGLKPHLSKRREPDHVKIQLGPPLTFVCDHCGDSYAPTLPAPLDMMSAMGKVFMKQHRSCKKKR